VGWHCLFARQYNDAIATCLSLVNHQKAVGLTYYYLGRVYARKGQLAEAIPALQTAVAKTGGRNSVLATLGYVYARAGRRAEAEQVLAELQQRSKTKYVAALDFAVVYAGFGDKEQMFNWLDKAYLERSTWLVHLKWDDRFAEFHTDPRFTTLLRRMGLPSADAPATPEKPPAVRKMTSMVPAFSSTATS
jgi:tetratricopeptide (TPR) repeat protein